MNKTTSQAVTLDQVVFAIKSAETNQASLRDMVLTVTKDLTTVSRLVFDYCSNSTRGAQARIAKHGISKSTVSRYYAIGLMLSRFKVETLVGAGISPNDINQALSKATISLETLESVKTISDLKKALSPKHPTNKGKAKAKASKGKAKPATGAPSLKDLTALLVDMAHLGKLPADIWADMVAKVDQAIETFTDSQK
jgi:hypothetical protein